MRDRVAMFHIGRCGSTVLGKMLDRHPLCHWAGELLVGPSARFPHLPPEGAPSWAPWCQSPYFPAQPLEFIASCASDSTKRWFGFEIQFYQLSENHIGLDAFVEHLMPRGGSRLIRLTRRNYLRVVVSNLLAMTKSRFHLTAGSMPEFQTLRINIDEVYPGGPSLVSLFEWFDARWRALDPLIAGHSSIALTYEDDVRESPAAAYRQICAFLGIDAADPPIELTRTTPWSLRSLVENLDEIGVTLKRTPYAWMVTTDE